MKSTKIVFVHLNLLNTDKESGKLFKYYINTLVFHKQLDPRPAGALDFPPSDGGWGTNVWGIEDTLLFSFVIISLKVILRSQRPSNVKFGEMPDLSENVSLFQKIL